MRRTAGIAGLVLLLMGAFTLGLGVTRAHDQDAATLPTGPRDGPPRPIDEVRHELGARYYRDVPADVLSRATIDRILAGLEDPYTDYLPPPEYAALVRWTAESYAGLGLRVAPAKASLVVKAALAGPGRAAGVRPGDRIVSIDGRRVRRVGFERALELIEGEEGTAVRLGVRRPGEGRLDFTVKRKEIHLRAVTSRLVGRGPGRLGHVRVLTFRAGAAARVGDSVEDLLARGARGIVLDLRGNPGGLLSEAVDTVSLFVESGIVCVTEDRNRGRREYEVSGAAEHADVPLVTLVDGGSASAAEIVAAALGDHGRARVVGAPTFGKASVQSVQELSDGAALKLTTAVFLTPAGANLSAGGVAPEVRAADRPATPEDEALAGATRVLLGKRLGKSS